MASLSGIHPAIREAARYALRVGEAYGLQITLTSGFRSMGEQSRLYQQYIGCKRRGERVHPGNRNPACRYPANAPGTSSHNYGLAFDSSVPESQWALWTAIREAVGFRVPPGDRVHAEHPDWRQLI